MTDTEPNDAPDLLWGVASIASYLGVKRRVAYHLIETRRIPYFKVGKTVCARRSKLIAVLERLEDAGAE
jgi:excisionase family DNA binding protein